MAWNTVWDIWGSAFFVSFVALQILALLTGNPLSRWIRQKLGIEPKHWRRWLTIPALWVFLVWFGLHITTAWV